MMGIFKPGRPSRQPPPSGPGIYRFRNKRTGKIDYVGETSSLKRRIGQHLLKGALSLATHIIEWKMADGRSTSKTRRQHEASMIDRHKPQMNRRRGGGGRRSSR